MAGTPFLASALHSSQRCVVSVLCVGAHREEVPQTNSRRLRIENNVRHWGMEEVETEKNTPDVGLFIRQQ